MNKKKLCVVCKSKPIPPESEGSTCSRSCRSVLAHMTRNSVVGISLPETKICRTCSNTMTRRPKEPTQSWEKREHCSKSCAAFKPRDRRIQKGFNIEPRPIEAITKLGGVHYIKGTPEFNRIAALYQGGR